MRTQIKKWLDFAFITAPAGFFLLAFLSGCAGNAASQATPTAAVSPTVITGSDDSPTQRLTIKLTLSSPADLKVREGDTITAGQIISDRVKDRRRLEAQKQKLGIRMQQLQQPIDAPPPARPVPEVAGLPPASFLGEVAAVERQRIAAQQAERTVQQQQRMLDMLDALPDAQLPEATVPHEQEMLKQRQQALDQANAEISLAQAQLSQAQQKRQFDEYQHSLEMSKRSIAIEQSRLQRSEQLQKQQEQEQARSFQIAQLEVQMQTLDTQLFALSAVRSPYSGTVQRIKYEGQDDQNLAVTLTLIVSSASPSAGAN